MKFRQTYGASFLLFLSVTSILAFGLYSSALVHSQEKASRRKIIDTVAGEIETKIKELKRSMFLFGRSKQQSLIRIVRNPDREAMIETLRKEAKKFFPEVYTLSLADMKGDLYYEDLERPPGDLCRQDLRLWAKSGESKIRVHPQHFSYHIDISVTVPLSHGKKAILFSSILANDHTFALST